MKKLTPALFVQLYMESHAAGHTMREFADRIGMKYQHAYARARHYRKRGVRLPALTAGRREMATRESLDIESLNAIVGDGRSQSVGALLNGRRVQRSPVVLAR